jgi:pentatricopeptide repeat protein
MITGFSMVGDVRGAACMLQKMEDEGIAPNSVTFQSLLNAFNHAGLPDFGLTCLAAMIGRAHHPGIEHCISALDLLGRAGEIEAMSRMIEDMPFHPNRVAWHAVLGACRKSGDVVSGITAFQHAVEMGGFDDNGAYLSMFNIYADARMHAQARRIDELMRQRKVARRSIEV